MIGAVVFKKVTADPTAVDSAVVEGAEGDADFAWADDAIDSIESAEIADPTPLEPTEADNAAIVEDNEDELKAILALVREGDLGTARQEFDALRDGLEPTIIESIETTLSAAESSAKALKAASLAEEKLRDLELAKAAAEANALAKAEKLESLPPIVVPDAFSVYFATDSSQITEETQSELERAVSALERESRLNVQLRGHSDKQGNSDYNAMLSRARAEVVKDNLTKAGVSDKQIEIVPFGESMAEEGADESFRRVELVFNSSSDR